MTENDHLIKIYEENLLGIERNWGKGGPRNQEMRERAKERIEFKLNLARSGYPLPTYVEKTRERERVYFAL